MGSGENNPCWWDDPGERRLCRPIRRVAVESLIQPMGRPVIGTEPFRKEGERRPGCSGKRRP